MSTTKVIIRAHPNPYPSSDQSILISESVIRRWKIPTDQLISLRLGSSRHQVRVSPFTAKSEVRIPASLTYKLGIPQRGISLRLSYKPAARTIRLGPLIGVMIPRITGTPGRRFGMITSFCKELTDACRMEGAFVYFFTPDNIRSNEHAIEGWTLVGQEYKASFPVPDVIYNRLPSRKLDSEPGLQQFIKKIKAEFGTRIFNEKYLDKTEVFDALRSHHGSAGYLPESHSFKNSTQLRTMCTRYRSVFLKPITGSLGKGIIRITKSASGFQVALSSMNGVNKVNYSSLNALISGLSGKLKTGKYQIQQGVDLIAVGGRPVDFRALVHKNITGKWAVSSIVARTAGDNRFVSNVAQGGTIGTVRQTVAKSNLLTNKAGVARRLEQAAIQVAQGIDARIPYHFGELGIDLAVDRGSGRVRLIEVNSKPAKNDDTLLNEARHIRPSVKLLVQYFRYLTRL
jgi:hypothetical protein